MSQDITPATARRRYVVTLFGMCGGYLASLFGVILTIRSNPDLAVWGQAALGAIPAGFLLGTIYAIWRYMGDMDEVARHFNERAMLMGLFAVVSVAGSYGLMEMIIDPLPRLPIFWVFPIFFAVYGVAKALMKDAPC